MNDLIEDEAEVMEVVMMNEGEEANHRHSKKAEEVAIEETIDIETGEEEVERREEEREVGEVPHPEETGMKRDEEATDEMKDVIETIPSEMTEEGTALPGEGTIAKIVSVP